MQQNRPAVTQSKCLSLHRKITVTHYYHHVCYTDNDSFVLDHQQSIKPNEHILAVRGNKIKKNLLKMLCPLLVPHSLVVYVHVYIFIHLDETMSVLPNVVLFCFTS